MKRDKVHITELFMAKAGWNRCFHGVIIRENNLVRGKIIIKNNEHDGYIYATASEQTELGKNLDELVLMILDFNLHGNESKIFKQNDIKHFLN